MPFALDQLFHNTGLLLGAGLAIVPILLHLLMRAKPKKLMFPALRLLQSRRKTNSRRLRLRHWWLLLLRILVILLIVLAIARPHLPAANYSLTASETLTLLGILAVAVGVYSFLMHRWRTAQVPQHELVYRRSLLRTGTGGAIFLLILLAVFWPYQRRISAEVEAPNVEVTEDLPFSAVFLFDTSLSMEYRYEGKTRLEFAKKTATDYIESFHKNSRVAVGGTQTHEPLSFREDLTVAKTDVSALETSPISVPLNQRLREAVQLQKTDLARTLDSQADLAEDDRQDQYFRAIFVFTDLSQSSWQKSAALSLRKELERQQFVQVYLIDVGVDDPQNAAVDAIKLSSQTLPENLGDPVQLTVSLSASGSRKIQQAVRIRVPDADGRLFEQKRNVTLIPGQVATETFTLTNLVRPVAQGRVELIKDDPLDNDNKQFFTIGSPPPPPPPPPAQKILILSGHRHDDDYLALPLLAKDPKLGRPLFEVDQHLESWLETHLDQLKTYDAVCLVNVLNPTETMWNALAEFTEQGRGLAIFLGHKDIHFTAYNTPTAQKVVPGELIVVRNFDTPETLSISEKTHGEHPVFKRLCAWQGDAGFSQLPVFKCWRVKPAENATVAAWFTNQHYPVPTPALIERGFGKGRVAMLTTGVTRKKNELNWSDLTNPGFWGFLVFAHDLMKSLNPLPALPADPDNAFNIQVGEPAHIFLNPDHKMQTYLFRTPAGTQTEHTLPQKNRLLSLTDTNTAGHYLVLDAGDSDFQSGFSVNVNSEALKLKKLSTMELDEFFGEDRNPISRNLEEMEQNVNLKRVPVELFPQVLALVILAFCAEHLVSNRFYEAEQSPTPDA